MMKKKNSSQSADVKQNFPAKPRISAQRERYKSCTNKSPPYQRRVWVDCLYKNISIL